MTRSITGLVLAGALVLVSCGGDDDAGPVEAAPAAQADDRGAGDVTAGGSDAPDYGLVTPTEASMLAGDPGITVIDVRTPEEYAEGHLADADLLIDFYEGTFADEIAALDPDGEYLIYCRSGNRSGQTYELMRQLGFEQVYDLDGGVVAHTAAGLPLSK
jgi:rhodanese-related sulfurtransferase